MKPLMYLAVVATCAGASSVEARPQPISLFNGRNLAGWEQGTRDTFRVEEGAIVGGTLTEAVQRKTFLCTHQSYSDFRLTARFRLEGGADANTGIQFRTQRLDGDLASEVSGYQADAGDHYWGTLYDEGRRNKPLVRVDQAKVPHHLNDGKWNKVVIVARGRHVSIRFNGMPTVDYEEADLSLQQSGHICLQVHDGGAMKVAFKDLLLSPM